MPERPALSRRQIVRAFERLGDRLAHHDVVADVHLIVGAVMVLEYDATETTRDIDAVWKPHGIVAEEARAVADELGLPPWWLNEQATAYIPRHAEWHRLPIIDHPNIRVSAIDPRQLLAMKALSARPVDTEDLRLLVELLGLQTPAEVIAAVRDVFPDEQIPPRVQLFVEDGFQ